ncbi:MAG: AbrB/MazE/SpoVT family DNA-binding domain-containing protein [Nitrososphaerota archaeon]|jgi:AbrB family looped-hinge helix DNA binding protein|nr:AbrB/MazE/SpoVT family DNA-binding domain-containing protein [Nitrososphaerota archaeon]MDG6932403.1 AbrB/MazE/SpoVT family DNA-binding domain-containing protein [Nitrososphaerota archaeon]MDG6935746.1 AbrB/MazE/SpoVT family DNA-binding domain-containing protein [Nitrososphaerota archaeon]
MDTEDIVKVTRNYQMTIPSRVRAKVGIKEGSTVRVIYDSNEGVIKIIPVKRKRITVKLGRDVTVEDIESAASGMENEATS